MLFNAPIGHWDTSNVTDRSGMFQYSKAFNQDLSAWILSKDVDLGDLFYDSGMSTANLCKLKAVGGAWLGVSQVGGAVCE